MPARSIPVLAPGGSPPVDLRDRVLAPGMHDSGGVSWLWVVGVFAAVGAALLIVLVWNRTLARRVARRTGELATE